MPPGIPCCPQLVLLFVLFFIYLATESDDSRIRTWTRNWTWANNVWSPHEDGKSSKGATSRMAHLETFSLFFFSSLPFVIRLNLLHRWSSSFVFWFLITSLAFLYLSKLLCRGFLQFVNVHRKHGLNYHDIARFVPRADWLHSLLLKPLNNGIWVNSVPRVAVVLHCSFLR